MDRIQEAIEERRARIARLQAEVEQLEQARELVGSIIAGKPMKPPPVRKERAVRAEAKPAKVSAPEVRRCRACGEPMPQRPKGQTGRHKEYHDGCRRSAKAPKTKAEPDPVPAPTKLASVVAEPPPVNQVAVANAAKWQKQCPLLNFETGARCSLLTGHEGLHSSSGRLFKTGLNPSEFGGTTRPARELDAVALRGRP